MSLAEWLIPEFDEEVAATRRVLERVPDGKSSWKPHPKSMTLGRLATLVAELPAWAVNALPRDERDIMPPGGPPPKFEALESTARILELFDRNAAAARSAIAQASDPEFKKPWAFKVGGRTVATNPKFTVYAAPCSIIWCTIAVSSLCTCGSRGSPSPRCTVPPRTSRTSRATAFR